jgi:hypothetical protein
MCVFPRKKPVLMFGFLGTWQFSSKAVICYVTKSSALLALSNDPVWFCLRAEPKREHLAATALRRRFGIECLSPRLRFRKLTQRDTQSREPSISDRKNIDRVEMIGAHILRADIGLEIRLRFVGGVNVGVEG